MVALKAPASVWQSRKDGPDHQLSWQATVCISLPGHPTRTFSSSNGFSTLNEAKVDAATIALGDFVREELHRIPRRSPGPAPALTCVSLLYEFCQQQGITIDGGETHQGALFGWKATLRWANGDIKEDWFTAPIEFPSASTAKKQAATQALERFLSHPTFGPRLQPEMLRLPSGEWRASPASPPPTLPSLRRPQVCGQQFCAADGTVLLESRNLEFKGVDERVPEGERWSAAMKSWLTGSKSGFEGKHVAVYVSAYLNAGISGRIVLGVADNGLVQGIPMTAKDIDDLSQVWASRLNNFWPPIPHGSGLLSEPILLDVTDGSTRTDLRLIVFEITPQPGPRFPYFWDRTRAKAHKKVEATISHIPADELTALIVSASRNGALP